MLFHGPGNLREVMNELKKAEAKDPEAKSVTQIRQLIQPVELEDYGGSLRPAVRAQIDPAIRMALAYLENFGVRPRSRGALPSPGEELSHGALQLHAYEAGRPGPESACRLGDARVLARLAKR